MSSSWMSCPHCGVFFQRFEGQNTCPGCSRQLPADAAAEPRWFYVRDKKKLGPLTQSELADLARREQLKSDDMLLREGDTHWVAAASVGGLFPSGAPVIAEALLVEPSAPVNVAEAILVDEPTTPPQPGPSVVVADAILVDTPGPEVKVADAVLVETPPPAPPVEMKEAILVSEPPPLPSEPAPPASAEPPKAAAPAADASWVPCPHCRVFIPRDEAKCPACGTSLTAPAKPAGPPGWFYVRDKKKHGPVPEAQLYELAKRGEVRPDDMVLREGESRWAGASSIAGLCPKQEITPAPVRGTVRVEAPAVPSAPPPAPPPPKVETPPAPQPVPPPAPKVETAPPAPKVEVPPPTPKVDVPPPAPAPAVVAPPPPPPPVVTPPVVVAPPPPIEPPAIIVEPPAPVMREAILIDEPPPPVPVEPVVVAPSVPAVPEMPVVTPSPSPFVLEAIPIEPPVPAQPAAPELPPLPDMQDLPVEGLVERFESDWLHGRRPELMDFVPSRKENRDQVLARLVHVDLECRLRGGETARIETYFARFPELAREPRQMLDLIVDEFNMRRRWQPDLASQEYLDRFPQQREALAGAFKGERGAVTPLAEKVAQEKQAAPGDSRPPLAGGFPSIDGYEIVERLSEDGQSIIYKARQLKHDRPVALEVFKDAKAQVWSRARDVARSLQNPNLTVIFDVNEDRGYIARELTQTETLRQRLAGWPLPAKQAAEWIEALAQALHEAHKQGLTHGRLTPADVHFAASADGKLMPKLQGFDVAPKKVDPGAINLNQPEAAEICYLAPEQTQYGGAAGAAVDIYALGAIFYEMLTGRPPLRASSVADTLEQTRMRMPALPSELQPLPMDLDYICWKCLQKAPESRYRSAQELSADLCRYLAGTPVLPHWKRAEFFARSRPILAGVIGGLVVLILILLFIVRERGKINDGLRERLRQEREKPTRMESEEAFLKDREPDAPAREDGHPSLARRAHDVVSERADS
jgi:hypothetical protein